MNYEERYKEALDLMKDCVPDENGLVHVHPEDIIPELRESEDEKIRKELIEKVKETPACIGFNDKNAVLAWLEKQAKKSSKWSEEDEKMVNDIIAAIDTLYYHGMVNWLKGIYCHEMVNWLKGIKSRI